MSTWVPAYLQDMVGWFRNPGVYMYGRWDNPPSAMEGGVDLGSAAGTPVYALADGVIIGAGNFWHNPPNVTQSLGGNPGYGVVTTRVNVPGYGLQDLYYQHIDIASSIKPCISGNCGQQVVHKGDIIGYIHPGVNMLEMGFNADWGQPWGLNHPGAWATDPRPMLKALMDAGPPATLGGQPTFNTGQFNLGSSSSGSSTGADIMSGIMSGLGLPTAADVQSFVQRFTLVFFGGLFVLIGVLIVFFSSESGKQVAKAGVEAAAA